MAEAADRLADPRVPSPKVTPVLARFMSTGRMAINRNVQRKRSNTASTRSCRGACGDGLPMGDRQRGDQEHGKDWVARCRLGFSPILLAHGGLWGCQPWKTAATGPGLACTPVCSAYRPALFTGLPAYQPALLTLCDVRRRGRRAGWAVLIRLRAAPVE